MGELEDIKTSIGVDTPFGGKEVGLDTGKIIPGYKVIRKYYEENNKDAEYIFGVGKEEFYK